MILEIAQIDIKPGMEAAFEGSIAEAETIFKRAKGFLSFGLVKSIEFPQRYRLLIGWETLENHIVDFRQSTDFQEWRRLVSDYFAATPIVEHVAAVPGLVPSFQSWI